MPSTTSRPVAVLLARSEAVDRWTAHCGVEGGKPWIVMVMQWDFEGDSDLDDLLGVNNPVRI